MKVYVIKKGIYSDRHVVGVVETEEEAKKICEVISSKKWSSDKATYEEYDTKQFQTNRIRFTVQCFDGEWSVEYDDYDLYSNYTDNGLVYEDFWVIYANSPEQAIKIAQDMKAVSDLEKE